MHCISWISIQLHTYTSSVINKMFNRSPLYCIFVSFFHLHPSPPLLPLHLHHHQTHSRHRLNKTFASIPSVPTQIAYFSHSESSLQRLTYHAVPLVWLGAGKQEERTAVVQPDVISAVLFCIFCLKVIHVHPLVTRFIANVNNFHLFPRFIISIIRHESIVQFKGLGHTSVLDYELKFYFVNLTRDSGT